jgi:hypothetical protein
MILGVVVAQKGTDILQQIVVVIGLEKEEWIAFADCNWGLLVAARLHADAGMGLPGKQCGGLI